MIFMEMIGKLYAKLLSSFILFCIFYVKLIRLDRILKRPKIAYYKNVHTGFCIHSIFWASGVACILISIIYSLHILQ